MKPKKIKISSTKPIRKVWGIKTTPKVKASKNVYKRDNKLDVFLWKIKLDIPVVP
jgi:hypothetical protein